MAGAGLAWDADALRRRLAARAPGVDVEIVRETASTNSDLLRAVRAADAVAFRPRLRVAEQQTAGRGRLGRDWVSQRGASLTFSLAWPLARADASGLSLAVGVAIAEALDAAGASTNAPGGPHAGADRAASIGLKWPNDLWLVGPHGAGRKLGGVLIETVAHGVGRVAVIGIGVNVRPPAPETAHVPDAAALVELVPEASVASTLDAIAVPLVDAIAAFEAAGFAAFGARYAARDALFARPVRTTDPAAPEGIARGVDDRGALLVETVEGALHAVSSGEVSVRLKVAEATSGC